MNKLIPLSRVRDITGQGKTSIYDRAATGAFPRGCKVGRRTLWVESEVQDWVASQIAARDDKAAADAGRAAARGARA
jgi:predicted DNA-binding transcriptional regulator AlpA